MEHKSILLVEDDYLDVVQVQRALGKLNGSFSLHTAFNGREALDLLLGAGPEKLDRVPDLILLDINMPRSNGFDFLGAIRQDKQFSNVPVFIITTSWEEYDRTEADRLGIAGYILKPLNFDNYTNRQTSMDTFNLLLELLR